MAQLFFIPFPPPMVSITPARWSLSPVVMIWRQAIFQTQTHNTTMQIEIQGNAILKDGEQIATFEGSTVSLFQATAPTVKGAIKKALGLDEVTFVVTGGAVPQPVSTPLSDEELLAELQRRGLALNPAPVPEMEHVEITPPDEDEELAELLKLRPDLSFDEAAKIARYRKRMKALNRLSIAVASGKISALPKRDPAMGEKDPGYVAWIRKNATADEFRTIYGDSQLPTREEFDASWKRSAGMKEVKDDA